MTYRMVVTRQDGAWLASAVDTRGAHTESDDLPSLDKYAREVVSLMAGLPDSAMPDLEFEWVFEVSEDDLVVGIAEGRGASPADVLAKGWSLADVAALLNVPVDRVSHVPPREGAHVAHA